MSPLAYFDSAWARCDQLSALYAYFAPRLTGALVPDELLRAEWVARVSAMDLYIHELVAQKMLDTFVGKRPVARGFLKFQLTMETITRIQNPVQVSDANSAFDLEVRQRLGLLTYQDPIKIADGIRLISDCSFWNDVALALGTIFRVRMLRRNA